ncbi:MAG TPA: ABC transporter substrate-binding protein [Acidimicrobiales bacterium]|nr:ABC transporter substrate-binding protein [Acidimicrobiales bacterium]
MDSLAWKAPRARLATAAGAAAIAIGLVAAGCGSSPTPASARSQQHPKATTAGSYPMKVTSSAGTVVVKSRPSRIVSLSPTATENLFAIGAGRQVVAVDSDSDYPPDAPHTKIEALDPNLEAVADYRPDLVIVSDGPAKFDAELTKLRIPVVNEAAPADLAQAYQQIEQLGKLTGHNAKADAVVAGMKRKIAHLVREVPKHEPPLTYFYELSTAPYYTVTSATFVGSLLSLLGLKDIADRAGVHAAGGYPQISSESIVAARPDLIFLADTGNAGGQTPATVEKRPGWAGVPAVKDGDILPLNPDIASRWSPRIVILMQDVVNEVRKVER